MGCGACSNAQVSDSKQSLQQRLLDKLDILKGSGGMGDSKSFISVEQIKLIENATDPLHETLRYEELQRFEAGQTTLLSRQRRIAWKVAIYRHIKTDQILPFTDHPTTTNENTKNRFYQISLDVKRTFPTVSQLNRQHLANVLENLTLNFQGIGYTQGMNFYIGFFLLCGFTPEEAFSFFVRLSYNGNFLLVRNFSENFKNANCCIKIMQQIMKQSKNAIFNELIIKIDSYGVNLFLFVFSWFLTYFLYNSNIKASLLIWDYIILFPISFTSQAESNISQNPLKVNIGPQFGNGFVNCINFALKILQSLSSDLFACTQISQMMNILRHDSIQAHLDEIKTQQLIHKCKTDPIIDWNHFKNKCQTVDGELNKIIIELQYPQQQKGHFLSFINQSKTIKRHQNSSFS